MDVAHALSDFTRIQSALLTLQSLQLTSSLYPPPASPEDGASYDFIVVGAGSAGAIIANRLTEDPGTSVLLIEAGGDPPLESNLPVTIIYPLRSQGDWNYTTIRNKCLYKCNQNHAINLYRGKMLGGSSSINYLFYVRGDPHDYNQWAEIANDPSWNYNHVLPYFMKSERLEDAAVMESSNRIFHNTDGYLGITIPRRSESNNYLNSFKELGNNIVLDTNGNNTLGFTVPMVTLADGIRQSTANAFLTPIKNCSNLYVMKNTLVTKIIIDNNNVARGVEVTDGNNRKLTFKANKEVVVSAGAINTPQLLMLSGIGPEDHLSKLGIGVKAALPVGKNMQDHMTVYVTFTMGEDNSTPRPPDAHQYPVPIVNGFVAFNSSQTYPDYQLIGLVLNSESYLQFCISFTFSNEICQRNYEKSKGKNVFLAGVVMLNAKTRGEILLRSSDPKDKPLITDGMFTEESDVDDEVKYLKDFVRIVNTTFFKSVGAELLSLPQCENFGLGSDEYWKCYVKCVHTSIFHYSGTCAMGSVVDSRLRIPGFKQLRVADASIMPTVPSGNINAASMMVGEKAADIIKKDHKMNKRNIPKGSKK